MLFRVKILLNLGTSVLLLVRRVTYPEQTRVPV